MREAAPLHSSCRALSMQYRQTSIYRCQTPKEGPSTVFMPLMLVDMSPICHQASVCKFSLQLYNGKSETLAGQDSIERGRQREKKEKRQPWKSLIFLILLGADLMHTTPPLPLRPSKTHSLTQSHPPNPHSPVAVAFRPNFSPPPFSSCYLHIAKVPDLERNPSTATSNFHLGRAGLDWLAGCSSISCLFP